MNKHIVQCSVNLNKAQVQKRKSNEEQAVIDEAKISLKHVSGALNAFIKFAESNQSCNSAELINLHIIRNGFLKKSSQLLMQS